MMPKRPLPTTDAIALPTPSSNKTTLGWLLLGGWLTYSLAFLGWQLMNDPLLLQTICRG